MKFLEETGENWAAVQMRAEMEIEQEKRDWEEKRQAQRQQEELDKQRADNENEILTYSRDDALNKVNITTKRRSLQLGKRKFKNEKDSPRSNEHGKKNNGSEFAQNGTSKEIDKKNRTSKTPKGVDVPRRNTRNSLNRTTADCRPSKNLQSQRPKASITPQRGTSRKSDRRASSNSRKSHVRSTSGSTSRSISESLGRQTSTYARTDDSDSECSLDVMIDSNDVNDSDSNSNQNNVNEKTSSRMDSSSRDHEALPNDDSTLSDETTIEKMRKSSASSNQTNQTTNNPRSTRSRGSVNVNLWTLDESSPILPVKRQRTSSKSFSRNKQSEEKQMRTSFGVKDCTVTVVDCEANSKLSNNSESSRLKSMPKPRAKKLTIARPRRQTSVLNKTL